MFKIHIATKKTVKLNDVNLVAPHWWQQLFIESYEDGYIWICPFTPIRLIASYFIPWSKWYKERITP